MTLQLAALAEENEVLQDVVNSAITQQQLVMRQVELYKQHCIIRRLEGLAMEQMIDNLRQDM